MGKAYVQKPKLMKKIGAMKIQERRLLGLDRAILSQVQGKLFGD